MNKRGGGLPMHERVARSREQSRELPGPPPAVLESPARHCWVLDPVDGTGTKRAGLLLEWRHTDEDEWEGRVVYVAALRPLPDPWVVVTEWVGARGLAAP